MPLCPGIYRHYKGNLYEVVYTARDSETERRVVVYRALYGERGVWVRDYEMFTEEIVIDGERVKRFSYVKAGQEVRE